MSDFLKITQSRSETVLRFFKQCGSLALHHDFFSGPRSRAASPYGSDERPPPAFVGEILAQGLAKAILKVVRVRWANGQASRRRQRSGCTRRWRVLSKAISFSRRP